MKKMTKLLALIAALVLVFTLSACAKPVSIIGTWKCNLDFCKVLDTAQSYDDMDDQTKSAIAKMSECLKGENIYTTLVMELKEDNTFTLYVDEESSETAIRKIDEKMPEILPELIASVAGMTVEEMEASLAEFGMSMEDIQAMYAEAFDADSLVGSTNQESSNGTYTYKDGKLTLTNEDGKTAICTIELREKEMKLISVEGDSEVIHGELLPLTFIR